MIDKSEKSAPINLSTAEIARFDALAESWWDPNGKYKTALDFNRARLEVIEQQIRQHFNRQHVDAPFDNLSIVDIGCGGGLISEPLAQKGALVTGVDASATSIEVAKRHAKANQIHVDYRHQLASELASDGAQFDVVIIDEAQDLLPIQWEMVKILMKHSKRVFIAGDDEGAVDGFRDPKGHRAMRASHCATGCRAIGGAG